MQKKAIRIISFANYHAHTAPLFFKLKILNYHKIVQQAKLHFMHAYHYNYAPSVFRNLWPLNADRELTQNLRSNNEYQIPRPFLEFFKRISMYTLPQTWKMAGFFKHYRNEKTFKTALKDYLLDENCPDVPFLTDDLNNGIPPPPPPHPLPPKSTPNIFFLPSN